MKVEARLFLTLAAFCWLVAIGYGIWTKQSQHHVEVTGKRDSGYYQDDPALGPDALITTSRVWTVDTAYIPPTTSTVRLNEILARNDAAVNHNGTFPDLIELFNEGASPVDLSGPAGPDP